MGDTPGTHRESACRSPGNRSGGLRRESDHAGTEVQIRANLLRVVGTLSAASVLSLDDGDAVERVPTTLHELAVRPNA